MKFVAFVLPLFLSTTAFAATYNFTKSNNHVEWEATGTPGFLRINGQGGAAEGTLTADAGKVSGTLNVALDAYHTGIDMRDEHMKTKFLETGKYPTAKLVLKDQPYTEGKESTVTGDLTVKDITKPVKVTFTVTGNKVFGNFNVNIKDYPSIGVPSYLTITVADDVKVTFDGTL